MASRVARLLCAGKEPEPELLRTRCAVLRYATMLKLPEAEVLLGTGEEFDLTVVSSSSSERERVRILSYANEMPTRMLHGLTLTAELMVQVERPLAPAG
jgi:hypothetical protein